MRHQEVESKEDSEEASRGGGTAVALGVTLLGVLLAAVTAWALCRKRTQERNSTSEASEQQQRRGSGTSERRSLRLSHKDDDSMSESDSLGSTENWDSRVKTYPIVVDGEKPVDATGRLGRFLVALVSEAPSYDTEFVQKLHTVVSEWVNVWSNDWNTAATDEATFLLQLQEQVTSVNHIGMDDLTLQRVLTKAAKVLQDRKVVMPIQLLLVLLSRPDLAAQISKTFFPKPKTHTEAVSLVTAIMERAKKERDASDGSMFHLIIKSTQSTNPYTSETKLLPPKPTRGDDFTTTTDNIRKFLNHLKNTMFSKRSPSCPTRPFCPTHVFFNAVKTAVSAWVDAPGFNTWNQAAKDDPIFPVTFLDGLIDGRDVTSAEHIQRDRFLHQVLKATAEVLLEKKVSSPINILVRLLRPGLAKEMFHTTKVDPEPKTPSDAVAKALEMIEAEEIKASKQAMRERNDLKLPQYQKSDESFQKGPISNEETGGPKRTLFFQPLLDMHRKAGEEA